MSSAEKSRPGEKAAIPETTYSVSNEYTSYPQTIVLSTAAESYLASRADDLALGVVETHQLSPALSAFYWLAFWAGHQSHDDDCRAHLERMSWERDLWYFCANNRGKRPTDFYAVATDSLWAEAVQ